MSAGRTDSLVVAAAKRAEVVQEGELVVLPQVGLLAGTLDHLEGSEGRQWQWEEA